MVEPGAQVRVTFEPLGDAQTAGTVVSVAGLPDADGYAVKARRVS